MSAAEFLPGSEFFDTLAAPAGPLGARVIAIGPVSIHLEEVPQPLLAPLDDHFKGFIGEGAAEAADLRLPLRAAGVRSFLDPRGDVRRTCVQRGEDGRILVYGHYFAAWFERHGRSGGMALCRPGWMGLRVPIEIFLRVYCAWRAIETGGFLLHAASIVRYGRAYVFFGHSGAGKTTVSRMSRDAEFVLSDDITLITREEDGYRAHSVPFRAFEKARVVSERRTYPVAGLYRLAQARHNRVELLPRAQAVAAVLSCLPFVTDRLLPQDPAQMMTLLDRVLRDLPVFHLEFTRSAGFWEPVLASVR